MKFHDKDGNETEDFSLDLPLENLIDFGLDTRAYNALHHFGKVETIGDILKQPVDRWLRIQNFGRKSLVVLKKSLRSAGIKFDDDSVKPKSFELSPVRIRDLAVGDRFSIGNSVFTRGQRTESGESYNYVKCYSLPDGDESQKAEDFILDDLVYRAPLPPLVKDTDPR